MHNSIILSDFIINVSPLNNSKTENKEEKNSDVDVQWVKNIVERRKFMIKKSFYVCICEWKSLFLRKKCVHN